jgi:hypothetical protein
MECTRVRSVAVDVMKNASLRIPFADGNVEPVQRWSYFPWHFVLGNLIVSGLRPTETNARRISWSRAGTATIRNVLSRVVVKRIDGAIPKKDFNNQP